MIELQTMQGMQTLRFIKS